MARVKAEAQRHMKVSCLASLQTTLPSCAARFPFMIGLAAVPDESNHWGTWKDLWDKAMANAHAPYETQTLPIAPFD